MKLKTVALGLPQTVNQPGERWALPAEMEGASRSAEHIQACSASPVSDTGSPGAKLCPPVIVGSPG